MLAYKEHMGKRKPSQPHKGWKSAAAQTKIHNRKSNDLTINAMVAPAIVDDPYSDNGERLEVTRSIRDDPLAAMHSRKEIDDAQFHAGRRYEKYAEHAEIGNIRAIDPSKESVDGGRFCEPITDEQIAAVRHLSAAAGVLGKRGEWLIREILVRRVTFRQIDPGMTDREMSKLRSRFFECLEDLAGHWGLKT